MACIVNITSQLAIYEVQIQPMKQTMRESIKTMSIRYSYSYSQLYMAQYKIQLYSQMFPALMQLKYSQLHVQLAISQLLNSYSKLGIAYVLCILAIYYVLLKNYYSSQLYCQFISEYTKRTALHNLGYLSHATALQLATSKRIQVANIRSQLCKIFMHIWLHSYQVAINWQSYILYVSAHINQVATF